MTGLDIRTFWASDIAKRWKDADKVVEYAADDVERASERFADRHKFASMDFDDAVNYLGSTIFNEDAKTLGRVYNIDVYVPVSFRNLFWASIYYLIPFIRSLDPGFPYQVTLLFDDKSAKADFEKVRAITNTMATAEGNLLSIDVKLDPIEKRIERGAYVMGAR